MYRRLFICRPLFKEFAHVTNLVFKHDFQISSIAGCILSSNYAVKNEYAGYYLQMSKASIVAKLWLCYWFQASYTLDKSGQFPLTNSSMPGQ